MRMMSRYMKGFHKGQKGFTLIELLVVIAILGILAAIVVPNVASFIGAGASEAKQTEYHNIQTSVLAMMVRAEATGLDADYTNVQSETSVGLVTATGTASAETLDDWIIGGEYPLKQAYDIDSNGEVHISP